MVEIHFVSFAVGVLCGLVGAYVTLLMVAYRDLAARLRAQQDKK